MRKWQSKIYVDRLGTRIQTHAFKKALHEEVYPVGVWRHVVHRRFGGTLCLHFLGWRIRQVNQWIEGLCLILAGCLAYCWTLKMEAVNSSETVGSFYRRQYSSPLWQSQVQHKYLLVHAKEMCFETSTNTFYTKKSRTFHGLLKLSFTRTSRIYYLSNCWFFRRL
jgi:hypothetical protein